MEDPSQGVSGWDYLSLGTSLVKEKRPSTSGYALSFLSCLSDVHTVESTLYSCTQFPEDEQDHVGGCGLDDMMPGHKYDINDSSSEDVTEEDSWEEEQPNLEGMMINFRIDPERKGTLKPPDFYIARGKSVSRLFPQRHYPPNGTISWTSTWSTIDITNSPTGHNSLEGDPSPGGLSPTGNGASNMSWPQEHLAKGALNSSMVGCNSFPDKLPIRPFYPEERQPLLGNYQTQTHVMGESYPPPQQPDRRDQKADVPDPLNANYLPLEDAHECSDSKDISHRRSLRESGEGLDEITWESSNLMGQEERWNVPPPPSNCSSPLFQLFEGFWDPSGKTEMQQRMLQARTRGGLLARRNLIHILVPPGNMGLKLKTTVRGPVVERIDKSTVSSTLKVGDALVGLDGVDISHIPGEAVVKLLENRCNNPIRWIVYRPAADKNDRYRKETQKTSNMKHRGINQDPLRTSSISSQHSRHSLRKLFKKMRRTYHKLPSQHKAPEM